MEKNTAGKNKKKKNNEVEERAEPGGERPSAVETE